MCPICSCFLCLFLIIFFWVFFMFLFYLPYWFISYTSFKLVGLLWLQYKILTYGYSLPDSSVHGILQARILEWVGIPFSRGSSWPGGWTWVSHIADRFFTIWATRQAPNLWQYISNNTIVLPILCKNHHIIY